jgi:glucose/arabinose dehydrogenase
VNRPRARRAGAAALALALTGLAGCAAKQAPRGPKADPRVLAHHEIRPEDLPQPFATDDVSNPCNVISPPPDARLALPPGFQIDTYAAGDFVRPRWAVEAPNGDVFVADAAANQIVVLRDADGDGKPEGRFVFTTQVTQPFGMAFADGSLFVGDTNAVVRFAYTPGQTAASSPPEPVAPLPGKGYREHWTRNVVVSPDGT